MIDPSCRALPKFTLIGDRPTIRSMDTSYAVCAVVHALRNGHSNAGSSSDSKIPEGLSGARFTLYVMVIYIFKI